MGKSRKVDGRRQVAVSIAILMPSSPATAEYPMTFKEPLILLVTSRQKDSEWILPKGGWEYEESVEEAAVRGILFYSISLLCLLMGELWEEAGIRGHVASKIGEFSQDKEGKRPSLMHCFEVHVDKIEKCWPEQDERERRWFTLPEALDTCQRDWMNQAIKSCSLSALK